MRHILSSFLAFHWMAVFGLLSAACVFDPHGGVSAVFNLLGIDAIAEVPGSASMLVTASFAIGFGLVSTLFLWALAAGLLSSGQASGEVDQVLRLAFSCGAGMLSTILIIAALRHVSGVLTIAAIHLAAMLATYAAIFAERWITANIAAAGQDNELARTMAVGAAHNSMLANLSGRPTARLEEGF